MIEIVHITQTLRNIIPLISQKKMLWCFFLKGNKLTNPSISSCLHPLNALIQVLNLNNQGSNRVQDPVKYESSSNKKSITLGFHDRFLVTEKLGRSTRIGFATRTSLVFPVDIHKKKEAERDD